MEEELLDVFTVEDVVQLFRQHPELIGTAVAALLKQEGISFTGTTVKKGIVVSTSYHLSGGRP